MQLYWIHLPEHNDIKTEGYVGVTSGSVKRRLYMHKRTTNPHLSNAFNKYGNKIIIDTILEENEDFCLLLEQELRPIESIGWNIAVGGGMPPSAKGIKRSEETKNKMRGSLSKEEKERRYSSRRGSGNGMFGNEGAAKGKSWFYDPVTKYSKYYKEGDQPEGWVKGRFSRKKINAIIN